AVLAAQRRRGAHRDRRPGHDREPFRLTIWCQGGAHACPVRTFRGGRHMRAFVVRTLAAGAFGLGLAATALAADYPTRPITMIVPFPPAGVADIVARPVAEALGRELGQPVVIEN